MIYLDSSALVKLALTEPESAALASWLAERSGQPLVSSALHRAEVPRAVWRAEPGALPRSYRVIKRVARVANKLRRVCFNGKTAGKREQEFNGSGLETLVLPSSSPANTMRFEEKLKQWRQITAPKRVAAHSVRSSASARVRI